MAAAAALGGGVNPRRCIGCAAFLLPALLAAVPALAATQVLIVTGLGGEPGYAAEFARESEALAVEARALTDAAHVRLLPAAEATRANLRGALLALRNALQADDVLVLYLVGHGSYDGQQYKFNLSGPDIDAAELVKLLDALPCRRQLVVATGSASGALADALARPQRLIVAATRNGNEKNATRFGAAFVRALQADGSDADRSGTLSVQEVFDAASRDVRESFERDKKLATEHARVVGDGAALFTLRRLALPQPAGTDAATGALLTERTRLNERIEALRQQKTRLPEADYESQLQALLLQLAELQERIDAAGAPPDGAAKP